ncbi:MAG TPA: immunoglobulin domain-containing protein [Gemmataceae bacterium]|nr:immunoglobulin domain-containing protein [Gemmataceae bacterium]
MAIGNIIQTGGATIAPLNLNNSILSNSNNDSFTGDLGFESVNSNGTTDTASVDGSTNLVMNIYYVGSSQPPPGVITSTADPNLNPLGLFGDMTATMPDIPSGPDYTPTMADSPSSPAYGAGNTNVSGLIAVDQRGQLRVSSQGLDLGAFEYQSTTSLTPGNASVNFSAAGFNIPISAQVTNADSTVNEGIVTFKVVNTTGSLEGSAQADVVNGQASATLSLPSLLAGSYIITETYDDTSGNFSSSSANGQLTVNPVNNPAPTTLAPSNASANFNASGLSVPISATVTSTNGVVNEGSVTFTIVNNDGTVAGSVQADVANGQASDTVSLPSLAPGSYVITESYTDSNDGFSDSGNNGDLTVTPASTSLTPGNTTVTFNAASLSIPISATVTSASGVVNEGTVTFVVINNGKPVGVAQGAVVNGQASATLSLPSLSAGTYTITESYQDSTGNFSDSSNNGQLSVTSTSTAPIITSNPTSQTATVGANVTFTASASGSPTPTVQWQVSTDGGTTWSAISGATSTTLALTDVTAAMNGYVYEAVFTNSAGTATTNAAMLTVSATTSSEPSITTQPSNSTVTAGQTATFTALASGSPTPTVQWQVSTNGGLTFSNISGATSTTLMLNNVATAMNGYEYQAIFSNSAGAVTSSAAALTVSQSLPPPVSSSPPPPVHSTPPPPPPPELNVPPLLGLFDQLLGATETVNADGSVTETARVFGFPLLVSTFNSSGNLESVTLFGINVTVLFESL